MLTTLRHAVRLMTSACLLFGLTLTHAAVPAAINYQGFLTNPSTGTPLTTAVGTPLSVTFKLWDALTAGNLIYSETQSVSVANGVFNVQIGTGTVQTPPSVAFAAVAFDKPYWLELMVGTETLAPRQPLASAPYALRAANLTSDSITFNTASGSGALASNTTGFNNTAIGESALLANTTGYGNTASGAQALIFNTTGYNNTASGGGALQNNTTGSANTASGFAALLSNTTGYNNTASGDGALQNNTTGSANTASGFAALLSNTTGYNNTASGDGALLSNTTGYNNTASGSGALASNTTGYWNTASGFYALLYNTTGYWNTADGVGALNSNTTGISNSAFGTQALNYTSIGSDNTASGYRALFSNTTANKNTAVGSGALQLQSYNGGANPVAPWDSFNTAVGYQALYANQPTDTITGTQNTALGANALLKNTTGSNNTAAGAQALYSNTVGLSNTATGSQALQYNTTGTDNTASGWVALQQNTTGGNNTAVGQAALQGNMDGSSNTAIGEAALMTNTSGSNNIAVGYHAGISRTTGNDNIDIGNPGVFGESSTIRIGTPGTQTDTYLAGTLHATGLRFAGGSHAISSNDGCFTWADSNAFDYSCAQNNAFTVRATGGVFFTTAINVAGTPTAGVQLPAGSGSWSSMSDRNSKTNVMAVDGLAVLQKLVAMPVSSWNYKTQDASIRHMGPMAQDFHAAFGVGEDEKHIATVDEGGVALAAIQGLYKTLVAKDREIARIKKKASLLERELAVIKTKLGLQ